MNTRSLIPVGLLLVMLLTACSPIANPTPEDSDMTAEEAKAHIMDLYQASAAAIATDGWDVNGSWSACSHDASEPRVRWNLLASRNAPLSGEPAETIAQAQKAWQERGHNVTVERDMNLTPPRWILSDPPYLTGTRSDGSYYALDIGDGVAYFEAYSACVSGDIFQLTSPSPTP